MQVFEVFGYWNGEKVYIGQFSNFRKALICASKNPHCPISYNGKTLYRLRRICTGIGYVCYRFNGKQFTVKIS